MCIFLFFYKKLFSIPNPNTMLSTTNTLFHKTRWQGRSLNWEALSDAI